MVRHKIIVRRENGAGSFRAVRLIRRAIHAALRAEGISVPCEINVLITDDAGIHTCNRMFRNVDKPTDVLSFPMLALEPGNFHPAPADFDPETGRLPLGDIMISYQRAAVQAAAYGHTPARETAYLTVHSVLHLLGYDHMDEGAEKQRMRTREKAILPLLRL